jgi:dTDP-4-amino-4,6-dideoxygalactose transaminase
MINNNMDFVDIFEQKICDYTGFKYAVCVDCCTNGIIVALELLNRIKKLNKTIDIIEIPKQTYMSVPMSLKLHGWNVKLVKNNWKQSYKIGNTPIFDAATDFHEGMRNDYIEKEAIVCVSFQQKKRLSLGKGGVILLDDKLLYSKLKRMVHDGRYSHISHNEEVNDFGNSIILGYHYYMEPEKAAIGITKLNQKEFLPQYTKHTYKEYPDLSKLEIFK